MFFFIVNAHINSTRYKKLHIEKLCPATRLGKTNSSWKIVCLPNEKSKYGHIENEQSVTNLLGR